MKPTIFRPHLVALLILTGCLGTFAASAAETTPVTQEEAIAPTHLEPLAVGEIATTPWAFNPAWFALLGIAVPGLTWLGFAWRRAFEEDPHRLRRSGIRELRRLLNGIRRSRSSLQARHLHGWCRAAARTWGVRVSAPSAGEMSHAMHTITGDAGLTSTWRELWHATERGLYAADAAPPSDWLDRASSAAAKVEVPRRERWFPNRLGHWLPTMAVTGLAMTCIVSGSARAAFAEPAEASKAAELSAAQPAALKALHANWNDWAAHHNVAAFQIQQANWNAAVAHATAAFVQHPSSEATRDNLRFALMQTGTMDPVLRRLLFGAGYQRFPALLSPTGWQRVALMAGLLVAAGLTALVITLYVSKRRPHLRLIGGSGLAAGVVLFVGTGAAWNAYGDLNQRDAGILLQSVNLSPAPTELVPDQETSPAPAGSVVLTHRSFLGWRQVSTGENNVSGWVRVNAVMPFYGSPRH